MVSGNLDKDGQIRWGLLSTARINRALIGPINLSPRNKLLAVASRSIVKAKEYAEEWDIPRAYGNYEDLVNDPDLDVVYVSLPNSFHAEWTIKTVEAGKHVLCEKPIALGLEEVDRIIMAGHRSGRIIAEAFMYRHHPQTIMVKEIIERGELGEIRLVKGSFSFNLENPGDVRLDKKLGGGCFWDVGCYPVSYARYVIGAEPVEVSGWQVTGRSGVDVMFAGQMRFDRDILAQFDCGFNSPLRAKMEIIGSHGALSIPNPFKPNYNEKLILDMDSRSEIRHIEGQDLYLGEVEDIADAVLNGANQRISLEDSRANTKVLVALLESAQTGIPVSL